MIELADVRDAAGRLAGRTRRTALISVPAIDKAVGATVRCKCEQFQRGGSFKFRGAYNAIAQLPEAERARGVFAYSSGNHAQAVALAAADVKVPAVILMPDDAPDHKVAATAKAGAEIVRYDRYNQDRTALANQLARERGLPIIPPFDHEHVMAGQGTVALEALEQWPDPDVFVAPLGGGGLLSGCATVLRALSPATRIIGIEPRSGDDFRQSLAAGHRVHIPVPRTIADGLQTDQPGALTFPVVAERVDLVDVVSDEEIVAAMRLLHDAAGMTVEPSGAAGLAALLAGRIDVSGQRVVVVLSGGNIAPDRFAALLHPPR